MSEAIERRQALILVVAIVVGLSIRIALVVTSYGSTDVIMLEEWTRMAKSAGLLDVYTVHSAVNHPPLSIAILLQLDTMASNLDVLMTDLLRLIQSACDAITAVLIFVTARTIGSSPLPPALFFILAPSAMFVSGFHGNTDSMMTMFAVASLLAVVRGWPALLGGALLGIACSIKIVPILLLPFLITASGDAPKPPSLTRVRFLTGFAAVCALTFLPALLANPNEFLRNVLFYGPETGYWGVTGILTELSTTPTGAPRPLLTDLAGVYSSISKAVMLALVAWLYLMWKRGPRRRSLPAVSALTMMILLATASGAGPQYTIWLLPFLWFSVGNLLTLGWVALSSVQLFVAYTLWSGGFPWYLANALVEPEHGWVTTWLGFLLWALVLFLLIAGWKRLQRGDSI